MIKAPIYKKGILSQDYDDRGRLYLKGTPVEYHRSKDYEETDSWYPVRKWTGQFRTHYICNDKDGNPGSFTILYLGLIIE